MKITCSPLINNTLVNKQVSEKQVINKSSQNITELPKASMAELLGRCQSISFGATNKIDGKFYNHNCTSLRTKENIQYNKEDGSFIHEIATLTGRPLETREFYPKDATEVYTKFYDNGSRSIRTTTPQFQEYIEYDSIGRETYQNFEDLFNQQQTKIETDFARGRRVIREINHRNFTENVNVINLRTGEPVTSGKLVIDTRYDQNSKTYITENIITKQVLRTEQMRMDGKNPFRIVDYYEHSGLIARELNYDEITGGYKEITYSGIGQNNRVSYRYISGDKKKEQIIEYELDGSTVKSNILYKKDGHGNVLEKTVFYGDSKIVDFVEYYNDDNTYSRVKYSYNPNRPELEKTFDIETKRLLAEFKFFVDGKTVEIETQFNEDGSIKETLYNRKGDIRQVSYLDKNENLTRLEIYSQRTGNIRELHEYDNILNRECISTFNVDGIRMRKEERDANDRLIKRLDYYEDGETVRYKRNCLFDGSYYETFFDEEGNVIELRKCDKYGRRIDRDNDNSQKSYRAEAAGPQIFWDEPAEESETEFFARVSDLIGRVDIDLTNEVKDADWQRLADIMELPNINAIKFLDHTTYKNIQRNFHPDKFQSTGDKEKIARAEKICSLVNSLYSRK